jgi:anti-repressor protein
MTDLTLFEGGADGLEPEHFGIDELGNAFVQAPALARALGYRDASNATRLLDDDETGTRLVSIRSSNGVEQRRETKVIFEEGMYRLLFRSNLPAARDLAKQAAAILRQLRETGVVDLRPQKSIQDMSRREILTLALEAEDRADAEAAARVAAEQQVAELEPAADAWGALANAEGDYSVREAAQVLSRSGYEIGQRRLFELLRQLGWCDRGNQAYQRYVTQDLVAMLPRTYTDPVSQRKFVDKQLRVTIKGLDRLRGILDGEA